MSVEANNAVVRRFNTEVIQNENEKSFKELIAPDFVNHSAPSGAPTGPEGMWNTFHNLLHPALSNFAVRIDQQVSEGEWVTTRKTIHGTHTGVLMGIPATGKEISIDVIDMVRVKDGRYIEHWGINTLASVLAFLRTNEN